MRRWDPWNAPLAIGLAGGLYALEWLVGVSLEDGLVDASLTGLVNFLFLTWWRG